jgi:hypothetical protein
MLMTAVDYRDSLRADNPPVLVHGKTIEASRTNRCSLRARPVGMACDFAHPSTER